MIAGLSLPDTDDRHVLAAAIRCGASVIVTFNARDFAAEALQEFAIEAQHPDEFAENLFDLDREAVLAAARHQRVQLSKPAIGIERYLDILRRQGLARTVDTLALYRCLL